MAQFLRLPSGGGVNVENISKWNAIKKAKLVVDKEISDALLIVITDEADGAIWFEGADARALYAWLEKNSITIGEDGEAVTIAAAKPSQSETAQRRRVFLNALASNDVNARYSERIKQHYGITANELVALANAGLIKSGRDHWEITMHGLSTINRLDIE